MGRRLLVIPDLRDMAETIISQAEPRGLQGFVITPEIVAPAADPISIARTLLAHGMVLIEDQPLKPNYVCARCGHPRYGLIGLRRMTPQQRRCTECGGRLVIPR